MPIPDIPPGGWESREQLFATYAVEPYCWSSEPIEFEWVIWDYRLQGAIVTRYRFDPKRFSCRCEENRTGTLTMVRLMGTGPMLHCPVCRKTDGPVRLDSGEILGSRRVPLEEAYNIMGRTNQQKVPGMPEKITKKDLFKRVR